MLLPEQYAYVKLRFHDDQDWREFQLLKDKDGISFKLSEQPPLSPIFTDETPNFSVVPPSVDSIISQMYFHGGLGEINKLESETTYRYFKTVNVDARRKGYFLVGPRSAKCTISTNPTMPTITNAGFETGTTTGWTNLDEVTNAEAHSGTYSAKQTVGVGAGSDSFYQDIPTYAQWIGTRLTLKGWAKLSSGSGCITINDGVNSSNSTDITGGSWAQYTVTHIVSPNATRLRLQCTATETGGGGVAYFDDIELVLGCTPSIGAVSKLVDYKGKAFAASGQCLLCWNGTDWKPTYNFGATITDLCVFGNYLLIGLGLSTNYYYWDNGATNITASTLGVPVKYFGAIGITLFGSISDSQVKSSTDPTNAGSWGTATTVGNAGVVINGVLTHQNIVMVTTTSGIYQVPSSGSPTTLVDLDSELDSYTAVNTIVWKSNVYIPTGLSGLYEYDVANAEVVMISPVNSTQGQTEYAGRIMAISGDQEYLYALLDNGTTVHLLSGRWEIIGSTTTFVWHCIRTITLTDSSNNVRSSLISNSDGVRKLFIGCGNTTDGIYYFHSPQFYELPSDTEYLYYQATGTSGDAYLITSWFIGDYPWEYKTASSFIIRSKNRSANDYVYGVYYQKSEDELAGTWTLLGTLSSAFQELRFPADISSLKFRFKIVLHSTSSPVQVEEIVFIAKVRPFTDKVERLVIKDSGYFKLYGGSHSTWVHEEFPNDNKAYYRLAIVSDGLSVSGNYITAQYKVDDDATWNSFKYGAVANESPSCFLYFPDGTIGKRLLLNFTQSSYTASHLIGYEVSGALRPQKRRKFEFTILTANSTIAPNDSYGLEAPTTMLSLLREMSAHVWPIMLETPDGQQFNINVLQLSEQLFSDSPHLPEKEYAVAVVAEEALVEPAPQEEDWHE